MSRTVTVKACYDNEARVWFVEESNLDGLSADAETIEALGEKLRGMILDLVEDDGMDGAYEEVPIELVAYQRLTAKLATA